MNDPLELVVAAARNSVEQWVRATRNGAPGDSEIEKLFYAALATTVQFVRPEIFHQLCTIPNTGVVSVLTEARMYELFIEPQARIGDYRVDFLIHAYDFGRCEMGDDYKFKYDQALWRKLVVECDGHDFHERTKEQAAKDRSRDRALITKGYTVFRFTGSELWRDPIGCADQVIDWWTKT